MLLNVQLGIRHTGSGWPARAQAPSKGMAHSLSDLARLPEGASSRNPAGSFPGVSRLPRRHSAQPLLQIIIIALPCDPLLRTTTHWSRRDNARTRRRGPRATFGVAVRFKTSRMGAATRPNGGAVGFRSRAQWSLPFSHLCRGFSAAPCSPSDGTDTLKASCASWVGHPADGRHPFSLKISLLFRGSMSRRKTLFSQPLI